MTTFLNKPSKTFIFTVNNPSRFVTNDEIQANDPVQANDTVGTEDHLRPRTPVTWRDWEETHELKSMLANGVNRLVCALEHGEAGTPHLQGFVTFKKCRRIGQTANSGLRKIFGPNVSWRIPNADEDYAAGYCTKEYFKDWDNRKQPGTRTDLETACDHVMQGGIRALVTEQPSTFVKYASGFIKLAFYAAKPRTEKPLVKWFFGATGTSKTRLATDGLDPLDYYISSRNLKWWDGYCQQPTVVVDDFRKDFCTFHELLRILDRYPYTCEIKGGTIPLNSPTIIITSAYDPAKVYDTREDVQQLLRRIDEIWEFSTDSAGIPTRTRKSVQELLDARTGPIMSHLAFTPPLSSIRPGEWGTKRMRFDSESRTTTDEELLTLCDDLNLPDPIN